MKIFFHYNGIIPDSPYFYYTFTYPPKTVIYYNNKLLKKDVIINTKIQQKFKKISNFIRKILQITNKTMLNASIVPKEAENCDLIHALNTIPITKKPYIVEFESHHAIFIGGTNDKIALKKAYDLLSQENCKHIIFWSKNEYENFHNLMPSDKLKAKSSVLYPAVPLQKKNKIHKKITIGFIARNFYDKGGSLVLPVMKIFAKSNKINGIIVTNTENILKNDTKNIKFYNLMPRQELYSKIFPKIDILIYPGLSDTYGFIFPEAASFGIPVITLDGVARKEIVHHKKSGIILYRKLNEIGYPSVLSREEENEAISELSLTLDMLLQNKKLIQKMSNYSYNMVKSGIFSIEKRNKKLLKIYNSAL